MHEFEVTYKNAIKMSNFVNYFSGSIQRQIIYYKNYGFIKFCKHMLIDFIHHHRLVVFQGDIYQNQEDIRPKIPVDFRLMSTNEHDISRLVDFWPDTYTPRLSTRQKIKDLIIEHLSAGERCMTAEYEGKIVYMGWFGTKADLLYTKKRGLRPGEVLIYHHYCSPEMRGNNLMSAMYFQVFKLLKKENYRRFVCYITPHNSPSIRVNMRFYGKPTQMLHNWEIFGFNLYFLSKLSKSVT